MSCSHCSDKRKWCRWQRRPQINSAYELNFCRRDQCVGARWEFHDSLKNTQMIQCSMHQCCHTTRKNADFMHAFAAEEWGEDFNDCVKSMKSQSFKRHHRIAQKSAFVHK